MTLVSILKPGQIEIIEMDLRSLAGVRAGAELFLAKSTQLNVLICNAGVIAIENLNTTEDDFETRFGVNHLANFLPFQLLKELPLSSTSPGFSSRMVAVPISGHRGSFNLITGS